MHLWMDPSSHHVRLGVALFCLLSFFFITDRDAEMSVSMLVISVFPYIKALRASVLCGIDRQQEAQTRFHFLLQ